ncbi:MAG: hypothetical protein DDT39_01560 [Firmicutes bacterium]|nr:hypothetical protein [candidate division NPL-UPA2 bacterium]MBT9154874.1 hypothetical protein [candidate division NPL-UPA2 bacterium]
MNAYVKKGLIQGLLGAPIGVFISTTIVYLSLLTIGPRALEALAANFALQYWAGIAIGFVFGAMSVVFDIDEWTLTRQSVVHFAVTVAVFLSVSSIAGWIPPAETGALLLYVITCIIIYCGIWYAHYAYWKGKISEVNAQLRQR